MPKKMVSVSVNYLFYKPMDEKIKTWTICFPIRENPNMEKALFDWSIMLQHDIKVKYPLIFVFQSSGKNIGEPFESLAFRISFATSDGFAFWSLRPSLNFAIKKRLTFLKVLVAVF